MNANISLNQWLTMVVTLILLATTSLTVTKAIAADPPIYLEIRDYNESSQEFWMDIIIGTVSQPVTELKIVSFEMTYSNIENIEYVSFEIGSLISGAQANIIEDPVGKLSAAIYRTSGGDSGHGVLLSLKFKAAPGHQVMFDFAGVMANASDGSTIQLTPSSKTIITGPPVVAGEWTQQNTGVDYRLISVEAISKTVAWACGRKDNYGHILRTTDGGENWTEAWTGPDTVKIQHVEAFDANNAIVTTYTGTTLENNISRIYKTTNGGSAWNNVYELPDAWLNYVKLFDSQNGIASGDPYNGAWLVLKTTDGGNSWQNISNPPASTEGVWGTHVGFCWLDENKGFFGTNTSNYYYTVDGGDNWQESSIPFMNRTRALAFNYSNYGVVSDYEGPMARTTNLGVSWDEVTPPGDGYIRHVIFYENAFWILQGNSIYKSTDNGLTWEVQASAESTLRYISFVTNQNYTTGWAVGDNGDILKYSNYESAVDIEIAETAILENYLLHQNYPNPFNPTTTIRYALQKSATVTLMVYNLKGQRVKQLVAQNESAGTYEILWDGTDDSGRNVTSGIYVYTIQAGSFQQSQKMILLR